MINSITITVRYDDGLEKITGYKEHPCIMSEDATFEWLFETVRASHPKIFEKHKPGELGFLLNDKPIDRLTVVLMDGDTVKFYVV